MKQNFDIENKVSMEAYNELLDFLLVMDNREYIKDRIKDCLKREYLRWVELWKLINS